MISTKNYFITSILAATMFGASSSYALYENDVRLTQLNNSALPNFVYPEGYAQSKTRQPDIEEEVQIYFERHYHPVAVMYYAMRNGMSVRKIKDIAGAAGIPVEHLDQAISSLDKVLPGGVCNGGYFAKDKDLADVPEVYSLTDLKNELQRNNLAGNSGEPTVADVISKYFNDYAVLSANHQNPNLHQLYAENWRNTAEFIPPGGVPTRALDFVNTRIPAHIGATADELLALVDRSNDYWFFEEAPFGLGHANSKKLSANGPILVSLYKDQRQAVVSPWQIDRIKQAKSNNQRLPVMFFYADTNVRPVSRVSKKVGGFSQLVSAYIRQGIKAFTVPSWEDGNYHTLATAEQLLDLFDFPSKSRIPNQRYAKALATIDNGEPLHVMIIAGKLFMGDPDRAVAMIVDGRHKLLPIHLIYIDVEPTESNFNICENAFNGPYGAAFPFGGPVDVPGGPVLPCEPETRVIERPRSVGVSPNGTRTVIDRTVVTVPCDGG